MATIVLSHLHANSKVFLSSMMLTDVARQATKRKQADVVIFSISINPVIPLPIGTAAWLVATTLTLLTLGLAKPVVSLEEAISRQDRAIEATIAQALPNSAGRPTLRNNDRGNEVKELQAALRLLGYFAGSVDGVFGQETLAAVRRFQEAAGIGVDGVVGPATWSALFPPSPAIADTPKPQTSIAAKPNQTATRPVQQSTNIDLPVLRMGLRGPAVQRLQERLKTKGFLKGAADGVFGQETKEAVQAFQRTHKLEPDGIVGPATWRILFQ